jgi:hypothetical protein
MDSNFYNDNRIWEIISREGHIGFSAYMYILHQCSEQWNGEKEKLFFIHKNNFKQRIKCKQTKFESILNSIQTVFNISLNSTQTHIKHNLNSTQTEFNLCFEYPKFLKKQASYFRGALNSCNSNRIEEKRIEKKRIEDNIEKTSVFDFESVWKQYPNKEGKKEAIKHFNSSVKSQDDFNNINKALKNYLQAEKVKKGYIKMGSTWFNNWKDWLEIEPKKHHGLLEDLQNVSNKQ